MRGFWLSPLRRLPAFGYGNCETENSGVNSPHRSHEPTVRQFDNAWRDGQSPRIDDFLPADDSNQTRILVDLIRTELKYLAKSGQDVRVEDYSEKFPQLAEDETAILELIDAEYQLRQRFEPHVSTSEYESRFPHLREKLSAHLATVIGDPQADRPTMPADVPSISGYRIEGVLGRGGMGVVYRARQIGLDRLVALKMLLVGQGDDPEALARFRAEAQSVAALQHPNIVQVYDVGEYDGRPYFSMEFVRGTSLADALARTPQSPQAAAAIVEVLARAMHVAHQRGIVHRDLKPANVLISDFGLRTEASNAQTEHAPQSQVVFQSAIRDPQSTIKIADFGLAKRLEGGSTDTHTGSILGTPSYMAPEQASGRVREIGPAVDVYALGAVLYECLTGRPPYKAATGWETIKLVLTAEPVPPARLQPTVPRDLETICLKCLEKETSRRYPSADDLANDLRRFQRHEPVVARPVGVLDRAWRWATRNPKVAALLCTLAAVLVVGLTAVTVLWRLADQRRIAAEQAGLQAATERDNAVAANARTRAALDDMTSVETLGWLKTERRLLPEQKAFLHRALKYYEGFAAESADTLHSRTALAKAQFRVGLILQTLGQHAEAEVAYRRAAIVQESLVSESPGVEHQAALGHTLNNLASLSVDMGRQSEAKSYYLRALGVRERLVKKNPEASVHRRELAATNQSLAKLHRALGDTQAADVALHKAVDIAERLAAEEPSDEADREVASLLNELALLNAYLGKKGDAESLHVRAIQLQKNLAERSPDVAVNRVELGDSLYNLANLYDDIGRYDDSIEHHRRALELRERIANEFPAVPAYRRKLANGLKSLALVLSRHGKRTEAEVAHRRAKASFEQLVHDQPDVPEFRHLLAGSMVSIAQILRDRGTMAEALLMYQQALIIRKRLVEEHPDLPEYRQELAGCHNGLANLFAMERKRPESIAEYRQAVTHLNRLAHEHPAVLIYRQELGLSLNNLALALRNDKQTSEAEAACRQSLELRERLAAEHPTPPHQQGLANTLDLLATILDARGRLEDAIAACRRSMEIREKLLVEHPKVVQNRQRLVASYDTMGNLLRRKSPEESLEWFNKAMQTLAPELDREAKQPAIRQLAYTIHADRAVAFDQLKRYAEAVRDWNKAVEFASPAGVAEARLRRAKSLVHAGDIQRATGETEALIGLEKATAKDKYDCAAIFALAAGDGGSEREKLESRAIEILNAAIAAGFRDIAKLKADKDFEAIRNLDGWKKIVGTQQ